MEWKEPTFDGKWFEKHQTALLKFANSWLGRWFFRLDKVGLDRFRLMEIMPNRASYDWKLIGKDIQKTTCFFTAPRFQRRFQHVYACAKRIVGAAAAWKLLQPTGFGFLPAFALTATDFFPTSGAVDGETGVQGDQSSWAAIRAASGTNSSTQPSGGGYYIRIGSGTTLNHWNNLWRSTFQFDTSALTSGATITAAVMSLFGVEKVDTFTVAIAPNIDIYTTTPASASAIAASDFANYGSTSQTGAPISYASFSASAYNDFTFSSTGRGNISKTGISKFGAQNANYDVANSSPLWESGKSSYLYGYFSGETGTTNDPKLTVTYTAPVAISVNDAITITESLTDSGTLGGINVNDAVTLTESVSMTVSAPGFSVNEAITVSESVTVFSPVYNMVVSDSITVTESISEKDFLNDIEDMVETITVSDIVFMALFDSVPVNDAITVTESVTLTMQLGPISVNDSVTVSDSGGVVAFLHAPRTNSIRMRSTEQQYPLMMDENDVD